MVAGDTMLSASTLIKFIEAILRPENGPQLGRPLHKLKLRKKVNGDGSN